jgi:plastocyanin
MRPRALLLLLVLLAFALAPLAASQPGAGLTATDDGSGGGPAYHFAPDRLVVAPGATVTVSDTGQEPHSVTAVDKSFDVTVQPGGGATFTAPAAPGEYRFYCKFHAGPTTQPGQGMAGVLVVQSANATTPASSSPPAKTPGFAAWTPVAAALALVALRRR